MKADIKVSIIVTIFNREKFLRRCIDSIINQTYSNLEIILVDDGSTDSSYNIVKEYEMKDNRIKGYHKSNGGTVSCYKEGFTHVTAEYMTMVDSDDVLPLDAIELMMDKVSKYNVDMIIGEFSSKIDLSDTIKKENDGKLYEGENLKYIYNRVYNRKKSDYMSVSRCGKIYKTELFRQVLVNTYNKNCLEDIVYVAPMYFLANSIYILNKPVYCYLENPNSVTTAAFKKGDFKIYNEAFKHTVEGDKSNGKANVYDLLGYFLYIKIALLLFSKLNKKEKIVELKEMMSLEYTSKTINNYKKLSFEEMGLKILLKLRMYNLIVNLKGTK